MKKSAIKPRLKKQALWFIVLYFTSIIVLGIFHEFTKLLINILK